MLEVFRPDITESEIAAAAAALRSGWIGRGPRVAEFERAWAAHLGVPAEHVVSVNCATEALFQVMEYLGALRGPRSGRYEYILMPANSYIGIANAARSVDLGVLLCDVERGSLNPNAAHMAHALNSDSEPTAIAAVVQHYGGIMLGIDAIAELCQREGLYLIQDCACDPLAQPRGDFAVWSFDAMKVLTAADGGILYCKDRRAADTIRRATLLGQDKPSGRSVAGEAWWEYTVQRPGRRAIMNDVQAAVGLAQLARLNELVGKRGWLYMEYLTHLSKLQAEQAWFTLPVGPFSESSFYTFWLATDKPEQRDGLAYYLRERDIYTTYRYWPVHWAYKGDGIWTDKGLGNCEWAAQHVLNLPLHPGLSGDDVMHICAAVAEYGRTLQHG